MFLWFLNEDASNSDFPGTEIWKPTVFELNFELILKNQHALIRDIKYDILVYFW